MPNIKGCLGQKVIAQQNITQNTMKVNRRMDDPTQHISIKCNIPQALNYKMGSMNIFNYEEELNKIKVTKYTKILQLENQYVENVQNFRY